MANKGFEWGQPVSQPGLQISTAPSCCFTEARVCACVSTWACVCVCRSKHMHGIHIITICPCPWTPHSETWLHSILKPRKAPAPRRDARLSKVADLLPPSHSAPFLEPNLTLPWATWPGQALRLWVYWEGGLWLGQLLVPTAPPSYEAVTRGPG